MTAVEPAPARAPGAIRRRSPTGLAVRRFVRNRLAVAGLVVLLLVAGSAILAPLVTSYDPNQVVLEAFRQAPSGEHLLGTDSSGRDVFSRLVHAGRVSLGIGLSAALIAIVLGTLLGAVAGCSADCSTARSCGSPTSCSHSLPWL